MTREDGIRTLAHRVVRVAEERAGPLTAARRARLLLAARSILEECSPREWDEWLRAFGVRT
jgi:hypothetical protein